jgi:hypothetical protein
MLWSKEEERGGLFFVVFVFVVAFSAPGEIKRKGTDKQEKRKKDLHSGRCFFEKKKKGNLSPC